MTQNKPFRYFNPKNLYDTFSFWLKIITVGELAIIRWFPYSDRLWKIEHFRQWASHQKSPIQVINIETITVDKIEGHPDYDYQLPTVIICSTDSVREYSDVIHSICSYSRRHGLGALLCFESIEDPNQKLSFIDTDIYQNSLIHPLYDRQTSAEFVQYLSKKFSFSLTKQQITELYRYVGGHPWLIKEVARQISIYNTSFKQALKSKNLVNKAKRIYLSFNKHLNNTNPKIGNNLLQKHNLFLDQNIGDIPKIYKHVARELNHLHVRGGNILKGNNVIDHLFTPSERKVLRHLLRQPQANLISREQIAGAIWNNQADYEDWALDQVIYRLRKKIDLYHLELDLVTKRGKGYIIK